MTETTQNPDSPEKKTSAKKKYKSSTNKLIENNLGKADPSKKNMSTEHTTQAIEKTKKTKRDKNKLTPRQQQILNLIQEQITLFGRPPTRAEIAKKMGFRSINAAEDHLQALARKKAIIVDAATSRGIRIIPKNSDAEETIESIPGKIPEASNDITLIPLVGRVAAGQPILAQEHVQKHLEIPLSLFTEQPDFFLTVRGLSMKDIGMNDGDLLAVKRTTEARNGQVVVARINEEVTVKRFYQHDGIIELHPENTEFSILRINPDRDHFAIEGLAVGLIRSSPLH